LADAAGADTVVVDCIGCLLEGALPQGPEPGAKAHPIAWLKHGRPLCKERPCALRRIRLPRPIGGKAACVGAVLQQSTAGCGANLSFVDIIVNNDVYILIDTIVNT